MWAAAELTRCAIIIVMNNPNVFSKPEELKTRNDNAEWAALKEIAAVGADSLSIDAELQRNPQEREKYRRRGKWLLEIVNRMPARPSSGQKAESLDRVYKVAEKAGIMEDLGQAIGRKLHPQFGPEIGRQTFGDEPELNPEEERDVEKLREKVFDLAGSEPGELSRQFPSGNFLYHGSSVDKIEKIFQSDGLKNGVALAEDDPQVSALDLNSGYEGISWSMNEIDALPGTRGHIAGFVAAPEDILSETEQLVIPSRPAPYEVLQMNGEIDAQELYRLKNQCEIWGDRSPSMGEKNSVDSNIMRMIMYKEGDRFFGRSFVYDYPRDNISADKLRQYYTVDEKGNLIWDDDLYQDPKAPPVALPWFQSLIDNGRLARNGYGELDSVEKLLDYTKAEPKFRNVLLATERADSEQLHKKYDELLESASAVRVRPEEMYFVTSHRDLDAWLKVMARTHVAPKGILLYDDDQVVVENFASDYEGNHKELGAEIGRAVGGG